MPETTEPSTPPTQDTPATSDTPPTETKQQTFLADDVTNQPTGSVEQSGPVTTYADHVPEGAPVLLTTKVVAAPSPETPEPSTVDVETA